MSDHTSREERRIPSDLGHVQVGDDEEISLEPFFRILRSYRRVIGAAAGVAAVLFALVVTHQYLNWPMARHAAVDFRVLFDGADRGEYPNGLPFAGSELVSNAVLSQVFIANELDDYVDYETFRNSILIVQAPTVGFELLSAEYESRILGEMSPADRARLDEEFRGRRQLLQQPLYTLDFVQPEGGAVLPDVLLEKVLNDVLTTWAQYAIGVKHVFDYQIDLPGSNVLGANLAAVENDVIRLDRLRGRIDRILRSLDELEVLPGAGLVRLGGDAVSLGDIRTRLEDLLHANVRPLLLEALTRAGNDATTRSAATSYVEARMHQSRLDASESAAEAAALDRAFQSYTMFQRYFAAPPTPEVGEYLNRVLSFAASVEAIDLPYRQRSIDRIVAAEREVARLEKEVADYEDMAARIGGGRSLAASVGASERESRMAAMEEVVTQSVQQIGQLYAEISASYLSPGTSLYTLTTPFSIRTDRAGFGRAIAASGLLLTMLLVTVVPLACVVHHWARGLTRHPAGAGARRSPDAGSAREVEVARSDGA